MSPVSATATPQQAVTVTATSPSAGIVTVETPASSTGALGGLYPAAGPLSGHRLLALVAGSAVYADTNTPAHKLSVIGISPGAVNAGELVAPVSSGPMNEPGWTWTPGLPVYAGPNGVLTQSPAPTGWLRILGVAQTPTRLLVAMREPITQGA